MTPEEEARKARGKEIHRRVMIALGAVIAASGLAAWHIGWGGGGFLQPLMFGRVGRAAASKPPAVRWPTRTLARWRDWSPAALGDAKKQGKLVLLSLVAPWSGQCRLMDETAYADPEAAALIAGEVIAVRVDAEARPDLALRYLSGGWPTTALLLPDGEVVETGTYMQTGLFIGWVRTVAKAYRARREEIARAFAKAPAPGLMAGSQATPEEALSRARTQLDDWGLEDKLRAGMGLRFAKLAGPPRPARFPHFDWMQQLLEGVDAPWAVATATRSLAVSSRFEDDVWGGYHRYAHASSWDELEREKLLEDQAAAVAVLSRLARVSETRRTLGYVERFLQDPRGGYYSSQTGDVVRADGAIVSGDAYFAGDEAGRLSVGLPATDRRLFASENAAMARAVLDAGSVARPRDRAFALKTLERWWRQGVRDGRAARRLGDKTPSGFLEDQAALAEAYLAAYRATGHARQRVRAAALLEGCEKDLLDEKSLALFDRRATGELPPAFDRLLVARLEYRAWRAYRGLAAALSPGDPRRERVKGRAEALRRWLWENRAGLNPAALAVVASASL